MTDRIIPEPLSVLYARAAGAYGVAMFVVDLDLRLALQHCTTPEQFVRRINEICAYIASVQAQEAERVRPKDQALAGDGKRAA